MQRFTGLNDFMVIRREAAQSGVEAILPAGSKKHAYKGGEGIHDNMSQNLREV